MKDSPVHWVYLRMWEMRLWKYNYCFTYNESWWWI